MRLTIRDIARMAGTSPTAVSFVLNGKDHKRVSAEKRKAILATVRKYGYRPSTVAAGLTLQRSFRIAVCTTGPFSEHPLIGAASHHEMVNRAAQQLHDAGYGVASILVDPRDPVQQTTRRLKQVEADGFLLVGFGADVLDKVLFSLAEQRIPAVAIGACFDHNPLGYSWAAIDRQASFGEAVAYLADAGLRRIAMLDIAVNQTHTALKRAGYERTMAERRLRALPLF